MENYLVHHGILGMKWGVRKYQNEDGTYTEAGKRRYFDNGMTYKEMKKSYDSDSKRFEEEAKNDKNVQNEIKSMRDRANKKEKEASELYKKYNFDGDDGGGGKTKADQKAGKQYMRLLEQAEDLRDWADHQGEAYVNKRLLNKYGETSIKQFKEEQNKRIDRGIKVAAAIIGTAGAAAIGYGMYKEFGGSKAKTFSVQELRDMGIQAFEPDRIKISRIKF